MKFSRLYNLIKESPDSILSPKYRDYVSYQNNHTFLILKDSNSIVVNNDNSNIHGHSDLIYSIKKSDESYVDDNIYFELGLEKTQASLSMYNLVKGRVWTDNNIISFWSPYDKSLVEPVIKLFAHIKKSPKEFMFEMGGRTIDPEDNSPDEETKGSIYTWEEFKTGIKEISDEFKDIAFKKEAQRKKDEEALAQFILRRNRDGD